MHRFFPLLALLFAGNIAASDTLPAESGPVQVIFSNPETFTDARYDGRWHHRGDNNPVLDDLGGYLRKQALAYLERDQTLQLTFTDIDLAGDIEPTINPALQDVRIVKDIYPPRLEFTWQLLAADGLVLREGREKLRDLGFSMDAAADRHDRLRHEKRLLQRWLHRTLGRAKPE